MVKNQIKIKNVKTTKGCQKVIFVNIDKDVTLLLMAG